MKKQILIALLISVIILAGGYYYFYILKPVKEEMKLPAKVKVFIQRQSLEKQTSQTEKKEAVKPKKAAETKKKEEPALKEKETVKSAVAAKKEEKVVQKPQQKSVPNKVEKVKKEESKKTKGYQLVYIAESTEDANRTREAVYSKGYHTAKVISYKGKNSVVISPFTDKWEAEFVKKSIVKDTSINGFKVVPIQ